MPREVFDAAAAQFEPEELAQLIALLVTINAWNRLGVAFRNRPGAMDKMLGLENVMPE